MTEKIEWSSVYKDFKKSGMTKADFAAKNGYNIHSLYKGFRKYEKESQIEPPVRRGSGSLKNETAVTFIPVEVTSNTIETDVECSRDHEDTPAHEINEVKADTSPIIITIGKASMTVSKNTDPVFFKSILSVVCKTC